MKLNVVQMDTSIWELNNRNIFMAHRWDAPNKEKI